MKTLKIVEHALIIEQMNMAIESEVVKQKQHKKEGIDERETFFIAFDVHKQQ